MKKILSLLFLLTILLPSCCEEPVEATRHHLADFEKALIPYQLGQVVNFTKPDGQPLALEVTLEEVTFREERPFCEWTCCKDFDTFEEHNVVLQSDDSTFIINFYLSATNHEPKALSVGFDRFTGASLFYDSLGAFVCDTTLICYDSLLVNDKYYYDVKKKACYRAEQDTSTVWADSLIYNDLGVLAVIMSNNDKYAIKG